MRWNVMPCVVALAVTQYAQSDELFVPSMEYPTIQSALDAAQDGDEIVLLPGEFSGSGNQDLRMPAVAVILRGETGDPADVVLRGPGHPEDGIVRAMNFTATSSSDILVQDLTIRSFTGQDGGAVSIIDSSPTFKNCVFLRNGTGGVVECFVDAYGGAVYVSTSSSIFVDCEFFGNFVRPMPCSGVTGDAFGGAVYASESHLAFESCLFERNRIFGSDFDPARGGALFASGSTIELRDCVFRENSVSSGRAQGGAVYCGPTLISIDSDYFGNLADGRFDGSATGGAIHAAQATIIGGEISGSTAGLRFDSWRAQGGALFVRDLQLINSTMANNQATGYIPEEALGGAIYINGSLLLSNSTLRGNLTNGTPQLLSGDPSLVEITNAIIRNGVDWFSVSPSAVSLRYSNIEGGFPGEGNIDADPLFEGGTFRLLSGSPSIDAGNTDLLPADTFDLDGDGDVSEPFPFDAVGLPRAVDDPATPDTGVGSPVVDMGAFEFRPVCRVDLDGDGTLTLFDFLAFQTLFDVGAPRADFDGDGDFTLFDFLLFQSEFAAGCG